jgi:hypothetical protein
MGSLINIGSANLNKGEIREGMVLKGWDSVSDCTDSDCLLVSKCNYVHKGKCGVQVAYIKNFCDTIFNTYKYLDSNCLFKVGMHLMPLYSHLCKLKIVEASISDPINTTAKGLIQVHPIYKEIRETLKAILMVSRDMDLFAHGVIPDIDIDLDDSDDVHGSRNHYKKISEETDRRTLVR